MPPVPAATTDVALVLAAVAVSVPSGLGSAILLSSLAVTIGLDLHSVAVTVPGLTGLGSVIVPVSPVALLDVVSLSAAELCADLMSVVVTVSVPPGLGSNLMPSPSAV